MLDANLTLSLPGPVTAATGIDAMVHAIEAYTSKIKKNPISDCLAIKALSLLGGNIRVACRDGGNREARGNMLVGSMLAGMAFTNAPVAANNTAEQANMAIPNSTSPRALRLSASLPATGNTIPSTIPAGNISTPASVAEKPREVCTNSGIR